MTLCLVPSTRGQLKKNSLDINHYLNVFENAIFKITATHPRGHWVNSLAPGKFEWNFRYVIFKWISAVDGWGISCEIALISMSLDFTDDQSTLVQVMAWCHQATSHCLSQCWPRSLLPYGVTRPQWVNYTPRNEVEGGYTGFTLFVRPSVRLSVCLSVRPYITWVKILHGIEYQRPTSLNMRILADHVTYSFLAFPKSIF